MTEKLQNIVCTLINQRINEKERMYNIAAREEIKRNIERMQDAVKKSQTNNRAHALKPKYK